MHLKLHANYIIFETKLNYLWFIIFIIFLKLLSTILTVFLRIFEIGGSFFLNPK